MCMLIKNATVPHRTCVTTELVLRYVLGWLGLGSNVCYAAELSAGTPPAGCFCGICKVLEILHVYGCALVYGGVWYGTFLGMDVVG